MLTITVDFVHFSFGLKNKNQFFSVIKIKDTAYIHAAEGFFRCI